MMVSMRWLASGPDEMISGFGRGSSEVSLFQYHCEHFQRQPFEVLSEAI